eukprot:scaffold1447_cov165-Ochromonas_danica.AAC.2
MAKKRTENVLRIGDYVTFRCVKNEGFLCAEGILREDLSIEENVKVFHDSLFSIHLQRQYSAARELDDFLRINNIDPRNIVDVNTAKYYQALKRGCDNERKLNDSYMKKKNGQPVVFGDIIQLFHVKSGKYLTVLPGKLARDERENIKVILDGRGSAFSWLQLCPRYKIDREGDRVLNHAEVYLRVSERSNEFVHRSDRDPYLGQSREVNCSLEMTFWKLNIFQSSADAIDRRLLLGSELVYINDPETRCNLTIAFPALESLEEEKKEGYDENDKEIVPSLPTQDDRVKIVKEEEVVMMHDYGNIVLQSSSIDYVNSTFLWFIEKSSAMIGGPISMKTDQVRFRHMNSGAYLKACSREELDQEGNNSSDTIVYMFTTTQNGEDPNTFFNVKEINASKRGDVLDDGRYAIKGTTEKEIAVNLIIQRYTKDVNNSSKEKEELEDEDGSSSSSSSTSSSSSQLSHGVKEPLDYNLAYGYKN